jgi:hypothetical protein
MLECVRDQLVDDEAARHGAIHLEVQIIHVDQQPHVLRPRAVGAIEVRTKAANVPGHRNPRQISRAVEVLVYQSHGADAVPAVCEQFGYSGIRNPRGLQIEQAGNELEVVLDPVVNFLQQSFLLAERGVLQGHGRLRREKFEHCQPRRRERVWREIVFQVEHTHELGLLQQRHAERRTHPPLHDVRIGRKLVRCLRVAQQHMLAGPHDVVKQRCRKLRRRHRNAAQAHTHLVTLGHGLRLDP